MRLSCSLSTPLQPAVPLRAPVRAAASLPAVPAPLRMYRQQSRSLRQMLYSRTEETLLARTGSLARARRVRDVNATGTCQHHQNTGSWRPTDQPPPNGRDDASTQSSKRIKKAIDDRLLISPGAGGWAAWAEAVPRRRAAQWRGRAKAVGALHAEKCSRGVAMTA